MRKLVTVRTVVSIKPIEGADNIVCATVDGWDVVVRKDEFNTGDKGVYFEIDSFLPADDARFEPFKKNETTWNNMKGIRIKTVKLRGQISQGLLLPLSLFPEINPEEEQDLTELLKVVKWEFSPPHEHCTLYHRKRCSKRWGNFPTFIPKTDQERIQNCKEVLRNKKEEQFEVTIKLDGSSLTVFHRDGEIGICSRNIWLEESEESNDFVIMANEQNIPNALKDLGRNLAVQGEMIGPKIQCNPEKITKLDYYVFDIYDIDKESYLGYEERSNMFRSWKLLHSRNSRKTLERFFIMQRDHHLIQTLKGKVWYSNTHKGNILSNVFPILIFLRIRTDRQKRQKIIYLLSGDYLSFVKRCLTRRTIFI